MNEYVGGERIPLQAIVAGAHAHEEGPVAQVIIDYFSSSLMRTTAVDILPPFPRAGRTPRSAASCARPSKHKGACRGCPPSADPRQAAPCDWNGSGLRGA